MKDLTLFDPLKDFLSMKDEIDRMFDRYFVKSSDNRQLPDITWIPPIDVEETKDEIIVKAEIPGMKKDDIKISLQNDNILIEGEKKQEKESKGKNYHRIERVFGKFKRMITLPCEVKADKVKAKYENGLLTINLPKSEETKSVNIPIELK
ncbi:MAG TPA: Hsp20/alpha crystallin family protein [Bacteroidetes bacterium]|uniref:Hsp20/alpha crystallin family protein n=1 Tax=candidate division TA06 bacterium TaxID=2250710 RepID=A0A660S8J1_UNCT6|nr:MAG: Hsp20/alpha crystallin family protein [candidate division TA06 bacterium]HHD82826.1 Hsp20/alpha crystallin family protein [Bacteroidota bacterium]